MPAGYRFLIQLVDAVSEAQARQEIRLMYGERCSKVAVFERGSQELSRNHRESRLLPKTSNGFTVYIPQGFIL